VIRVRNKKANDLVLRQGSISEKNKSTSRWEMSCKLDLAWLLHASLVVSINCAGVYGMVGSTSDVRNARVQTALCQAPHLTLGSRAVPYEYNALAYICAREG